MIRGGKNGHIPRDTIYLPSDYIIAGDCHEALHQGSHSKETLVRAIKWHSRPISRSKNLGHSQLTLLAH